MSPNDTRRPTLVGKKIYSHFGEVCHNNNREIRGVIEDLMKLYNKKGEKLFN
jgi:hypothetical protein